MLELGDYTIKNVSERAEAAYVVRDLQLEHVPVSLVSVEEHYV